MVETTFSPNRPVATSVSIPLTSQNAAGGVAASSAALPRGVVSGAAAALPRLCACGCGIAARGTTRYASSSCSKRVSRDRAAAAAAPNAATNAATSQSYDPLGTTEVAVKNSFGKKIRLAAAAVAAKFGQPFTPKPEDAAGQVLPVAEGAVALPGVAAGAVDRGKAFRKLCGAFTKTGVRCANTVLGFFARRAGLDDAFIEKKLIPAAAPPAEDVENFKEALDDYLRSINYCPEKPELINLMIAGANLGAGYAGSIALLSAEIKRKREATT